jgi:hypothetical protein
VPASSDLFAMAGLLTLLAGVTAAVFWPLAMVFVPGILLSVLLGVWSRRRGT